MAALLYPFTLFLGAGLLFVVEPLFAKRLLPVLGGSPAVWNVCVAFYQAAVLGGYACAHGLARVRSPRVQVAAYLGLALAAGLVLPPRAPAVGPGAGHSPVAWLLVELATVVGLPLLALATTAPLLQSWYARARAGAPRPRDPYHLYAASNLGSLIALLAYPLAMEPALSLAAQAGAWSIGYGLWILAVLACAIPMWRERDRVAAGDAASTGASPVGATAPGGGPREPTTARPPAARDPARPGWTDRAWWLFLAFVPSSLSLGVTTYTTANLAAMPLLWVVPLALYLLTYVLAFRRSPPRLGRFVRLQPFLLVPVALQIFLPIPASPWPLLLHLGNLFVTALVCHSLLAARRPTPARLTEFYFWASLGGVLGGLWNALVAPVVFTSVAEYAIAVALAGFGRPGQSPSGRDLRAPALVAGALLAVGVLLGHLHEAARGAVLGVAAGAAALACFSFSDRPLRFALGLFALVTAGGRLDAEGLAVLHAERSFFAVHKVERKGDRHILVHGDTVHGMEGGFGRAPKGDRHAVGGDGIRGQPLGDAARHGPLADLLAAFRPERARRVAVVGLGAGVFACHARAGERWTFYEIDPAVERIARDPRLFTCLGRSRARVEVVIGDGRLGLGAEAPGTFDAIVLNAFSSDSVPVHLVTVQALDLYLTRLRPGGLLVFHVSNRYLRVADAVAATAAASGLAVRTRADAISHAESERTGRFPSEWAVLARQESDLALLAGDPRWRAPHPGPSAPPPWTDEFSSIRGLVKWWW